MENIDPATFSQQLLQLGLVTMDQMEEARNELATRTPEPQPLLGFLERKGYMTPWQTSKFLKGHTDGFYLGGYRVLYRIASGSFGRVFRADDPRTGRVVAIKVLRRRWSEDQARIDLFYREGRVGMSLKHPNIVEVLEVDKDHSTDQYYIVMEFVEGGNLREILEIRQRLTVPESLRIIDDATSGLAYAYSKGVSHRDVKMTNLLLSSHGTTKLADFGMAQVLASIRKEEKVKVERTVDYAGLERATGVPPGDVRSDIYFLGCILYQALTGRPPLRIVRDKQARMHKNRFAEVTPIRHGEISAPPSVYQLVDTMMSLQPQRRYQTPSQLLEAIRACRRDVEPKPDGGPVTAAGPRTVFVVESNERLQEGVRKKFKELGYKVLMASDPDRALERYRQQPFDALVLDADTTGEDGLQTFVNVMGEAVKRDLRCAGILLLPKEHPEWTARVHHNDATAVLTKPVTLKQLYVKLCDLVPLGNGPSPEAPPV